MQEHIKTRALISELFSGQKVDKIMVNSGAALGLKYNMQLPFSNYKAFQQFEVKLNTDGAFQEDVVS